MAMTNSILVTVGFAALLGAGLYMRRGVVSYIAGRAISRRFQAQLLPEAPAGGVGDMLAGFLSALGARFTGAETLKTLRGQLHQAGFYAASSPYIYSGIRIVLGTAAFAGALLLLKPTGAATDTKAIALASFAGFGAFRFLHIALRLRIEARLRSIRRELPYVIDLMLMVLDAGVSIDQVLHHVSGQIGRAAPITAALLERYLTEIEEGLPYDQALERLASRLVLEEGRDFSELLKLNLFQGGELGPPLRRLATDIGETRMAYAREQIGRKSVFLTLTMLVFFMPVLMLALAGPAVHDVMTTLHDVARDLQTRKR